MATRTTRNAPRHATASEVDELMAAEYVKSISGYGRSGLGQANAINDGQLAALRFQQRSKAEYGENVRDLNVDNYLRRNIESRDMGITAGSAGGYTVPQGGFLDQILFGLKYFSAFFANSRVWHSMNPITGKPFGGPASLPLITSETSVSAVAINENTLLTEGDATLAKVTFGQCPAYSATNLLRIGRGLLQDSEVNVPGMVAEAFAQRIGRALDSAFAATILANASIPVVTTGAATTITLTDLGNLVYTLDLAHRGSDHTALVMSKSTAQYLRTLTDSSGRPLMQDATMVVTQESTSMFGGSVSRTVRVPVLWGIPILESPNVANIASTAKSIILANFNSAFVVRFVEASIQTLVERYADVGEVGYIGFARIDGVVADTAAAAILQQHV